MGETIILTEDELFEAIEAYMAWRGYATKKVRYESLGRNNLVRMRATVEVIKPAQPKATDSTGGKK